MTATKHTPAKSVLDLEWIWYDFGSGYELTTTTGGGLCVIAGRNLSVRDETGRLVPIKPEHPVARTVVAAPGLLAACKESRAALARIARGLSEEDGSALVASATFAFISDVLTPAIELAEGKQS